MITRSKSR